jgi:hypothetical protein
MIPSKSARVPALPSATDTRTNKTKACVSSSQEAALEGYVHLVSDTLTKRVIPSPRWIKSWEALIHRRRACALISCPPKESNGREESRRLIKHPESLRLGRSAVIRLMQAGTRNKRCRQARPLTGRPDSKSESDQGRYALINAEPGRSRREALGLPSQGRHRPRSSLLAGSAPIREKTKNQSFQALLPRCLTNFIAST